MPVQAASFDGKLPASPMLQEIFAGVWPHVFSHLLLLVVLVAFPSIILWLPAQMSP